VWNRFLFYKESSLGTTDSRIAAGIEFRKRPYNYGVGGLVNLKLTSVAYIWIVLIKYIKKIKFHFLSKVLKSLLYPTQNCVFPFNVILLARTISRQVLPLKFTLKPYLSNWITLMNILLAI
jgi:hypothetical protein